MAGLCTHRIVVVSGGGSAATGLGCRPRNPAAPASVTPPSKLRRLNRRACCERIGTSLAEMLVSATRERAPDFQEGLSVTNARMALGRRHYTPATWSSTE